MEGDGEGGMDMDVFDGFSILMLRWGGDVWCLLDGWIRAVVKGEVGCVCSRCREGSIDG